MNTENITWYSLDKDDLSGTAIGVSVLEGRDFLSPHAALTTDGDVAVGYLGGELERSSSSPNVFVLRDLTAYETFSWLKTFSPDSFPLSQFARVISLNDWEVFQKYQRSNKNVRPDRWACVILGEFLAQGGNESEIASIPLSRASACFSTAIARARFLYNSDEITRLCTDRLRQVEADRRFVRRNITVDDLVPIWSLLSANIGKLNEPADVVDVVLASVMRLQMIVDKSAEDPFFIVKDFPEIMGDSVEGRVLAFNRLVSFISDQVQMHGRISITMSAALAAGAFLVGRGTSHSFLLKRVPALASSSFIWFGLMAALIGPRGWDAQWARIAKGFERHIKGVFSWGEPPAGDICWAEYFWVAKNFNATAAFNDVARLVAKTLTIEVVPDVTCQLRVSVEESRPSVEQQVRQKAVPSNKELEMSALLEQFVILANRSKLILSSGGVAESNPHRSPEQGGLGFEENSETSNSKPKSKVRRTTKRA